MIAQQDDGRNTKIVAPLSDPCVARVIRTSALYANSSSTAKILLIFSVCVHSKNASEKRGFFALQTFLGLLCIIHCV